MREPVEMRQHPVGTTGHFAANFGVASLIRLIEPSRPEPRGEHQEDPSQQQP